jgi:cytochrome c2
MSVLNTRSTLLCLSLIVVLFAPASSGAQALSAFSKQKAERLLKEHLPCLGCHKLNGEGGTVGPDLTSVRQRRSPAYIAAMISDPQRVVPG